MKTRTIISISGLLFLSGLAIGKVIFSPNGLNSEEAVNYSSFTSKSEILEPFETDDCRKKIDIRLATQEEFLKAPDIQELISVENREIKRQLKKLHSLVYGQPQIPETFPDTVYKIQDPSYRDLKGLEGIEKFEIKQDYGINSYGYIFHPESKNGRLIIYHQGHGGDFSKGKSTIAFFLEKGFTIYAFAMPLYGKNTKPYVKIGKLGIVKMDKHEYFKYLDHPMRFFVNPVTSMINYGQKKGFDDINMGGLSGGGWAVTLVAAVDHRVKKSFPVAGSYPMFIRFQKPKKNLGDFEQNTPLLFTHFNYLDSEYRTKKCGLAKRL